MTRISLPELKRLSKAATPKEGAEYEGHECSLCGDGVVVEYGNEWEDGMACYRCCSEYYHNSFPPEKIHTLIKCVEEARDGYSRILAHHSHSNRCILEMGLDGCALTLEEIIALGERTKLDAEIDFGESK